MVLWVRTTKLRRRDSRNYWGAIFSTSPWNWDLARSFFNQTNCFGALYVFRAAISSSVSVRAESGGASGSKIFSGNE
jgi:hypothetical protein